MSDEVEQLGNLVKGKDENGIITFILNHSNNELVKLRGDYQTKNGKDFWFSRPSKNFNLDLISINEINKDFSEFKSRKEEMKVKKELLNLIKKVKKSKNNKNNAKYKRPENPLYSSYHDFELFI